MAVNLINRRRRRYEWKDLRGRVGNSITVRIDRKTIFGNPFVIGRDGTRDEVIRKFTKHMHDEYAAGGEYQRKMNSLATLVKCRNVHLACWCSPEACHGSEMVRFLLHLNSVEEV